MVVATAAAIVARANDVNGELSGPVSGLMVTNINAIHPQHAAVAISTEGGW